MPRGIEGSRALDPGCEMWLVAEPELSKWSRKIDWHLNFQIMRSKTHRTAEISSELRTVLQECDFEAPAELDKFDSPLLIASYKLLPNIHTIMVPFHSYVAKPEDSAQRS